MNASDLIDILETIETRNRDIERFKTDLILALYDYVAVEDAMQESLAEREREREEDIFRWGTER